MKSKETVYVDLHVLNWKKYHPDSSAKRLPWFKCDAGMVDGPNFVAFTGDEFKFWIYLLSLCARQHSDMVRVSLVHARRNVRLRVPTVVSAIAKLEEIQAVRRINSETGKTEIPLRLDKRREDKSICEEAESHTPEAPPAKIETLAGAPEKIPLTESLAIAEQTWTNTLAHFKIERPILERERLKLARMIQQHGELTVRYALLGPRGEKSGPDYDPGQHLSLDRIFNPQKLERFINLGSQWNSKANRQGAK